ncbi:MAG: 3-hydroxyacyl-CoA dehydrogenase [Acidobacteria bacterium]|nr:3-hydroxyacyl-CoA dehydrogenase [Acidobacteriota bacterium]
MTRTIAVLGAGTMGHGIAHAAMAAGYQTRLYDISQAQLDLAVGQVMAILKKGMDLGTISQEDGHATFDRLQPTTSVADAVKNADVVIEAVPEKADLKVALLSEVEAYVPADAVIASNTSALSITELAAALENPGRMGGMHFFNPVHKMKLVEIVRALETTEATLATMTDVAQQMGKETVLIRESPGFITSRINALIGNEAFYMLQEGVASARDIDKALKLGLNHPMGPFELVDLVGLDTRLSILQYLHRTLGEKFRPCPLLEQHVKGGRLGRKVRKGVYDY